MDFLIYNIFKKISNRTKPTYMLRIKILKLKNISIFLRVQIMKNDQLFWDGMSIRLKKN